MLFFSSFSFQNKSAALRFSRRAAMQLSRAHECRNLPPCDGNQRAELKNGHRQTPVFCGGRTLGNKIWPLLPIPSKVNGSKPEPQTRHVQGKQAWATRVRNGESIMRNREKRSKRWRIYILILQTTFFFQRM